MNPFAPSPVSPARAGRRTVIAAAVTLIALLATASPVAAAGSTGNNSGRTSTPPVSRPAAPRPVAAPSAVPAARQVAAANAVVAAATVQARQIAANTPAAGPWGAGAPPPVARQQAAILAQPAVVQARSIVTADAIATKAGATVIKYDLPPATRADALDAAARATVGVPAAALPAAGPWGAGAPPTVQRVADQAFAAATAKGFRAQPAMVVYPPGVALADIALDPLFTGLGYDGGAPWSSTGIAEVGPDDALLCNLFTKSCAPRSGAADLTVYKCPPGSKFPGRQISYGMRANDACETRLPPPPVKCPAATPFGGAIIPAGFDTRWCSPQQEVPGAPGGTNPGGTNPGGTNPPGTPPFCPAGTARAGYPIPSTSTSAWCNGTTTSPTVPGDPGDSDAPAEPGDPLPGLPFDPDTLGVVLVVDVPNPFHARGRFVEETARVVAVEIRCAAATCPAGSIRVNDVSGTLTVASSTAGYRRCGVTQSNCEFFESDADAPFRAAGDGRVSGGSSTLGFFSPTTAGSPMRATVVVDEALLDLFYTDGSFAATFDASSIVQVRTVSGATVRGSAGRFVLDVPVIGSVGN